MQRRANERQNQVGLFRFDFLSDQTIQPAGVESVLQISLRFEQLDQVLDRGAKVAADRELLQSEDEILARDLSRLAPRKTMPELRVGELVQPAASSHAEVAPNVSITSESELRNCARARFKTFVGVFTGDSRCNHMPSRYGFVYCAIKVDFGVELVRFAKQISNVFDAVQRQAHGDLELTRGQVHIGDHFCARVLHLEARIQLEEAVGALLRVVQVLHCARAHIAHHFGELDGVALHILEHLGLDYDRGRFFDDLLVSALD